MTARMGRRNLAAGLCMALSVIAVSVPNAGAQTTVLINEVDADTEGTDILEFVELYDGGVGNTALDGLVVVFFNGNGDVSYNAFDLDGFSTDADGFFLLGNADVAPDIVFPSNGLQNGADAVALYTGNDTDFPDGTAVTTTNLIDAVVYDTDDADDAGLLVLLVGGGQLNENENGNKDFDSNQRCPDGAGSGADTSNFVQAIATPRALNNCDVPPPTGACCVGTTCTIETEQDCIDAGGSYQGDGTGCDPNPCEPVVPDVLINEVDADTEGTDILEFVELYDAGVGNTALDGLVVVFFNGNGDVSYNAFDLDGFSTDADGFFLLGNADVAPDIVFPSNGLQNGADAVALYIGNDIDFPDGTPVTTTNLIDAVVYDTNDADDAGLLALLLGGGQLNEDENGNKDFDSNQRCPDGGGSGRDTSNFVQAIATPRALNNCPLPSVSINEIRIDQPSTDNDEYFELTGDPGESLEGLTYVVIGDASDAGVGGGIEAIVDLSGLSVPADGFFLAVEDTFTLVPLGDADLVLVPNGINFENSDNVTHMLVTGFTGSSGDDVDDDDDGVIDPDAPWTSILDCVALVETPDSGELIYCETTVGPDGSYVPGHARSCPDGSGSWLIGQFDPAGGDDTPGAANSCPGPGGACCVGFECIMVEDAEECLQLGGEYQGDNTVCDPNPCIPTGACCSEDYSCVDDLTEEQCSAADPGATWIEGGTCAEDCVAPTGSCCLLDGTCATALTEAECADARGRQWTEGATDCVPACEAAVLAPVIISEYYESAPGSRKAIEVFNTSPEPVSLYGHALALYSNYSTTPTGVFLLDDLTIGGFEAMVFINNTSDDIPNFDEATAIVAPSACSFNGDDAVAILFGDIANDDRYDVFAVPGERDDGPRGSDPYKDAAWERRCDATTAAAEFDSCNFDGLKDCDQVECPPGTPVESSCEDGANANQWVFEGLNPYDDNGNHSLGVHDAACLDIKPGSCPNSFNRGSHGVLPVAVPGMDALDAAMIDVGSVLISRADGVGGSVAPHEGPPGPHSVLADVATPFDGQRCECDELGGDGILDLSMKFKTDAVVAALELDDLDAGALVELVVSGNLVNGTPFQASDCIRLVPPGTAGAMLSVESSVSGAYVEAGPLDKTLDGGGFADFQRTYPLGTVVTLTAEESLRGCSLRGWYLGDFLWHKSSVKFTLTEDMTVKAVYDPAPPWSHSAPVVPTEPDTSAPAGAGMLKTADGG